MKQHKTGPLFSVDRIREIQEMGKYSQGKKELIRHLSGKKLSRRAAMVAHCYECSGYYSDGRVDCGCPACPLYDWMPHRGKTKDSAEEPLEGLS